MNLSAYKEKLLKFNSSEKYKGEMDFMLRLMKIDDGQKVLDYGCGIGTMIDYLSIHTKGNIFGYDKFDFFNSNPPFNIRGKYHFTFDKVYFMHSFAHIENINYVLEKLSDLCNLGTDIYVLTPNSEWLAMQDDKLYEKDLTVIHHYSMIELIESFSINNYKLISIGQYGKICVNINERIFAHFKK